MLELERQRFLLLSVFDRDIGKSWLIYQIHYSPVIVPL
ncbi:hypothetical protein CEV33_0998 [Brucella grignonensis]|uniref:Uncharacterized protein n=1 Tax=Brucella grignonensis TaxID=94627 RepID=A0A256FEL1_9HYPH|nr:hypothetical protein CEV33_0998 [Brucella grignonensis]